MTSIHEYTLELRERRHYDPAVIQADAWVCAECETFIAWRIAAERHDI
jgi:hypothetical protein